MKIKKENIKTIRVGYAGLSPVDISVLEIGNTQPTVTIVCGIHGNEYSGLYVVEKLLREINSQDVIGTLKIILNANPWGQALKVREVPKDNADLNRICPGNADADLSKRIANSIYKYCLDSCAVIDLHTFEDPCVPMAIYMNSGNEVVRKQSMELIKISNCKLVWRLNYSSPEEVKMSGALCATLAENGVPSYAIEVPEEYLITEEEIAGVVSGIKQSLIYCKVLTGNKPSVSSVKLLDRETVRSDVTGLYQSRMPLQTMVEKGDIVGELTALPSMKKTNVLSPYKGLVVINKSRGYVSTGDRLFCIGSNLKSE
jgi:hypothetical protein